MGLKLEVCDDSDMARTFAIISSAFGHDHAYIDAAFPAHDTPAGQAIGAERMLSIKHSNTTFLKVLDATTRVMIAQAKWNIFKDTVPPEQDLDGDFWESEQDKERKMIRETGGNLLSLDILTVDPACQRRGAGRILVEWGTKLADELGFTAVAEASECGRRLYESEGLEFIDRWETKLPEKWEREKEK